MNRNIVIALVFFIVFSANKLKAQYSVNNNQTAIGVAHATDRFTYDSRQIAHYGLGWYYDSWNSGGHTAYLSGWAGIKLFSRGALRMVIKEYGNVGIGLEHPASRLHLADNSFITLGNYTNANVANGIHFTGFRDVTPNFFGASIEASPHWICCGGYPAAGYPGIKRINMHFYVHNNQNDTPNGKLLAMVIHSGGNVGIGVENPNAKLAVNGNIRAKEVKVEMANWPDYVFGEDYELPDIKALASYIKSHKHLPGVPTAAEVEAEGIDLGEMNRILLEKVEELTLLLIEKSAGMERLEAQLSTLSAQMSAMENRISSLGNDGNF